MKMKETFPFVSKREQLDGGKTDHVDGLDLALMMTVDARAKRNLKSELHRCLYVSSTYQPVHYSTRSVHTHTSICGKLGAFCFVVIFVSLCCCLFCWLVVV